MVWCHATHYCSGLWGVALALALTLTQFVTGLLLSADLEFELHLRPLTVDEGVWRQRVAEATLRAEDGAARVVQLEGQVAAGEEQLEQHRWREATLRQQLEAGEQRAADLRAEVNRLRAQVHDLRVYSSALRTAPRSAARTLRSASRMSLGSQESLECGTPRSLVSEDTEVGGWWREARLGGTGARSSRSEAALPPRSTPISLPPSLSPPPSLPPLASLPQARPSSGAVLLPPIEAGQGSGRGARHVRRQIRLTSAPAPGPVLRMAPVPHREPT